MADPNLTERQAKYFASMRASLRAATGKTLDEWVAIAQTCPRLAHRAARSGGSRKTTASSRTAPRWSSPKRSARQPVGPPDALIDALWTDPASRAIFEAIDQMATAAPGALRTARKGYTAWSRAFQFAAARPLKGGG